MYNACQEWYALNNNWKKKLVEILELIVDICFSQCNLETCEKFENTKREINRIHIS